MGHYKSIFQHEDTFRSPRRQDICKQINNKNLLIFKTSMFLRFEIPNTKYQQPLQIMENISTFVYKSSVNITQIYDECTYIINKSFSKLCFSFTNSSVHICLQEFQEDLCRV